MKRLLQRVLHPAAVAIALTAAVPALHAGPFILAGTDADDHGSVTLLGNQDGWFFMQRALENLAPNVTNGNKVVVTLGSSAGTALNAANSAFGLSSLNGAGGWTIRNIDGTTDLDAFFNDTLIGGGISTAGILMMDSGGNVGGGATLNERNVFTSHATTINSFLGSGGGLFSQSNGYGWVNVLLPSLTAPGESNTGIALTAAGNAAFPGLMNSDLSSGPYHNRFENYGTLPVLATSTSSGNAIILGASGGTVTDPDPPSVPDAGSFAPVYAALLGLLVAFQRRKQARRE